jgi:hypothetical protein
MIVVKVELHSAITHRMTELGRLVIANDGTGTFATGNYDAFLGKKGADNAEVLRRPQRTGRIEKHARNSYSVWVLVLKALVALRIGVSLKAKELAELEDLLEEDEAR